MGVCQKKNILTDFLVLAFKNPKWGLGSFLNSATQIFQKRNQILKISQLQQTGFSTCTKIQNLKFAGESEVSKI